jgi:hypothetical protein
MNYNFLVDLAGGSDKLAPSEITNPLKVFTPSHPFYSVSSVYKYKEIVFPPERFSATVCLTSSYPQQLATIRSPDSYPFINIKYRDEKPSNNTSTFSESVTIDI